jgi:hypothetical protein
MMRLTVDSWVASQSAEGFLPYEFGFLDGLAKEVERMSRPNLIRQTLAGAALAAYYQYSMDRRLQDPIRRALEGYRSRSIPIGKSATQAWLEKARLLSVPIGRWKLKMVLDRLGLLYQASGSGLVPTPDGTYAMATPGAVALALLTEVVYSRASGDESFSQLRSAWLEGLLSLHIPGRGFRQDATSIDDDDYYSNGEGWLALAVYSDRFPEDRRVERTLREVDDALMERYSNAPQRGFFHWGAMAAARRFRTTRDPRFIAFLRAQATLFLDRFQRQLRPGENNCAAMEGLAATLAVLPRTGERVDPLAENVRGWLKAEQAKLPKLQIQPGQELIALNGDAYLRSSRIADFSGAFLAGLYDPEVRLDVSAHCISAMVMIEQDHLL